MTVKSIGFIGLGKMGSHIAQRIMESGQSIFVYDSKKENVTKMVEKGAFGCGSIGELAEKLEKRKVIILSVPAGEVIDDIIKQLDSHLSKRDAIIDLGNSFYKDSQRRAEKLGKRGIDFIDVGMSGGIDGAKHGACLMIGGNESKVSELDYLFKAMSRNGSYEYFGKSGSGHLVKGYHNLIEYGYLQSLAEGLESLHEISKKEGMAMNLEEICDIWSKGSIIESKILLDAKKAFQKYHALNEVDGSVYGQTLEEMEKLIEIAANSGVKVYSCKAAVKARTDSQKNPTYSGKIINAIRNVFGGHKDWKK
jgi:6-phosphogluconate dehydrogenase